MKEILKKYQRNFYNDNEFISDNVGFAFSESQLQDLMTKWNIKDKNELTTINGLFITKKIIVDKLLKEIRKEEKAKDKWLKSLNKEEKESIINYELVNHECYYTGEIEIVVEKLGNITTFEEVKEIYKKGLELCGDF